jgi:acetyl esterase/lipase
VQTAPAATTVESPSTRPVPSIDPALPVPAAVDRSGTCSGGSQLCTLMDIATWSAIPLTPEVSCSSSGDECQVLANIYGPTHPGSWPLFVLVSGADEYESPDGVDSAYIDDFAKQLAGRGAVVLRANWRRGPQQGAGFPASFADIGCAIGVSRRIGADYGADASHVTLVGHSSGGWASTIVGLTTKPFAPTAGSCNATTGSLVPDAWAGIAPALDHASSTFVGGTPTEKPDAWKAVDAFALVTTARTVGRPVTLIVGDLDSLAANTRLLQAALKKAGFDSVLVEEPGADHPGVLEHAESVDALLALAGRARN